MYKTATLTEMNRAGYDSAMKLATASLEKIERLAKLNLRTAKNALAEGAENASALSSVKDIEALIALNAELTEAGVQNALGYTRSVYGIAAEAQSELSALAEETFAAYTKGITAAANAAGFSKMVPPYKTVA
ncbi:MAG TPA: phasin family protein [Casimicrobiaceae bacterium]|nr:phasin family protein [Casimicrobiaceae bacterium]